MKKIIHLFANINILIGVVLICLPLVYLIFIAPLINPNVIALDNTPKQETTILTTPISNNANLSNLSQAVIPIKNNITLSVKTDKQYIKIPSIGIDTQFFTGNDTSTLDKGVWLMPNQGYPDANNKPVVLAAHRWGPDNATYEYRSRNLFYNLPNIKINDVITLNWNGIDYNYKVIFKEENTYVSRLSDLIMMTCVDYHSKVRYFVYAQKI